MKTNSKLFEKNKSAIFGEKEFTTCSTWTRDERSYQDDVDVNPLELYDGKSIDSSYFSSKKSFPAYASDQIKFIRDNDAIEEIDVLCVNCYECIPLSLVDSHSKYCLNPQIEEEESESAYTDKRIKKIIDSINLRIQKSYGDTVFILEQLREIAYTSLENSANPYSLLSRLDSMINSVSLLDDGISCTIIAKRLSNLVELKAPFFDSRVSDVEILKYDDDGAEWEQREINRWMFRSEILMRLTEDTLPQRFYEISSDVGSDVEVLSVSFSTGYSEFSDIDNFEEEAEIRNNISNEQLKKHFYSIFLKKKQQLPRNHKPISIDESELYSKCKSENIPVSKWEEYINKYFK